ncbi:MAG: hypothetical protein AAF547_25210, partial [Actinomycetota bacterium]
MAEATSLTHERDYVGIALEFAKEAAADRYGKKHGRLMRLCARRHLNDLKKVRRKSYPYEYCEW